MLSNAERKELSEYVLEKLRIFSEKEIFQRVQLSSELIPRCTGMQILGRNTKEIKQFQGTGDYRILERIEQSSYGYIDQNGKLTKDWKRSRDVFVRSLLSDVLILIKIENSQPRNELGVEYELYDFSYTDKNTLMSQVRYDPKSSVESDYGVKDCLPELKTLKVDEEGRGYLMSVWNYTRRTPPESHYHVIFEMSSRRALQTRIDCWETSSNGLDIKYRKEADKRAECQAQLVKFYGENLDYFGTVANVNDKFRQDLSALQSKIDYRFRLGDEYNPDLTAPAGEWLSKVTEGLKATLLDSQKQFEAESKFLDLYDTLSARVVPRFFQQGLVPYRTRKTKALQAAASDSKKTDSPTVSENTSKSAESSFTQQEFNQADKNLNELYQRAMRTLSESAKSNLKSEQRKWIKDKESSVKNNPGQALKIQIEMTNARIAVIKELLN